MGAASTFIALRGTRRSAEPADRAAARFTAIGFVTHQPMFIAVSPQIGVGSVLELIALAKSKPNQLSYATTGRGHRI